MRLAAHEFPRSAVTTLLFMSALVACTANSVYQPVADREGIKRVIHGHRQEVEACYEKAIEARPGAEGKVVISWDIGPDGHVVASSVSTVKVDAKIAHISPCLESAVQGWSFPRLSEEELEVGVKFPFFFSENGRLEVR